MKSLNKEGQLHDDFLTISPSGALGATVLRKYLATKKIRYKHISTVLPSPLKVTVIFT